MNKKLSTVLIFTVLAMSGFAQTISEPYKLFPKANFRPPQDTIIIPVYVGEIRYRVSDATFYKSISMTGKRWDALISNSDQGPDTLAIVNSVSPGISTFWTTPGSDTMGMKRFKDGSGTTVVQNADSSYQVNLTGVLRAVTSTLNFPPTAARKLSSREIIVIGARDGDAIALGIPGISSLPGVIYVARCKAANVVVITMFNTTGATVNPPPGPFKVKVLQQ